MTGDKAVMISIQPKWIGYILAGKKTDEVRKDKPMPLECPFTVYIYCTKKGDKLNLRMLHGKGNSRKYPGNVCAEFVCDGMTYIQASKEGPMDYHLYNTLFLRTCLTDMELFRYLAGNLLDRETFDAGGWAWHITRLKVYDEPKPIDDFMAYSSRERLKRPPQSWFYVKEL